MQNQLHTLDPSLRSANLSSPPKPQQAQGQPQQYQDPVHPAAYSPLQPSPNNSYQSIQTPSYYGTNNNNVQDSPEDQSPTAPNPNDPNDLKRPRACEACRQLKVKCELDENSPNGSCKRCAKAHRQCVITVPSRKRQKKTDSRVAELEKKIDALTAALGQRGGHDPDAALDPAIAQQHYSNPLAHRNPIYGDHYTASAHQAMPPHSPPNPAQIAGMKRKTTDTYGPFGGELPKPSTHSNRAQSLGASYGIGGDIKQLRGSAEPPSQDFVERGLIDLKTAYKCFDRYHSEMCQRLPVVAFPPGTKAEEVRKTKPTLFQAVVAVASGTIRPDLQSKIISDVTHILADRIVYAGEKSMELVQAIQIMTVFYQPPERYEELNFNQLVHIAAVMAMDIGMGKRSKRGALKIWKEFMEKSKSLPDPNAAETRRCWLGCYYMCSNSAMSLRRPLLVRWSPYADECIEILKSAPDALPTDAWLCHIVKAQHIAESIGTVFAMDDPAKEIKLVDANIQHHLKGLEQELERWHKEGEEFMQSPILKHTKAIITLYMHEIAMHNEHNIDDFRPPYHTTMIEGPMDPESVTQIHIASLTQCLHAAHAAFDAFLSMDLHLLRSLPTHFFVRNSYAAVALIKLYTATAAKEPKTGAMFQPETLQVDSYLDKLITTLTKVAEGNMSKVAAKFSMIFQRLRKWHLKRTEAPSGRGSREHSQSRMQPKAITGRVQYGSTPPPQNEQHNAPSHSSHMWSQPSQSHQVPQQMAPAPVPQRTGLQMLSDAAIAPQGRNSHSKGQSQQQQSQQQAQQQQQHQQQQQQQQQQIPGPPNQQLPPQSQGQWLSSPPPQQTQHLAPGHPQQQMQGGPMGDPNGMVIDPMMVASYGMGPESMNMMDFTTDELMAYGFGDEFMAMNFGFDQGGGWAI